LVEPNNQETDAQVSQIRTAVSRQSTTRKAVSAPFTQDGEQPPTRSFLSRARSRICESGVMNGAGSADCVMKSALTQQHDLHGHAGQHRQRA
jgi:hypothetical protein